MSNTYYLVCHKTRQSVWIGQGWGEMTTFYSGEPDTLESLKKFLQATFGQTLNLVCADKNDSVFEYERFDSVKDRSLVVWVVGQALLEPGEEPDGLTPYPWSIQGVFETEAEAAAVCRGPLWFVGPMTMGECLPVENVRWDGAYYPVQE